MPPQGVMHERYITISLSAIGCLCGTGHCTHPELWLTLSILLPSCARSTVVTGKFIIYGPDAPRVTSTESIRHYEVGDSAPGIEEISILV